MKDCVCGHSYGAHGVRMCLTCLVVGTAPCPGYTPARTWTGPGESDEGWSWLPGKRGMHEEEAT